MREFKFDHRNNPGLHRLYIGWAAETLQVVDAAIEELSSHSRVTSSLFAGALIEKRREIVLEDAAFFEAAALLHVGADLSLYAPDPPDAVDAAEVVGSGAPLAAAAPHQPPAVPSEAHALDAIRAGLEGGAGPTEREEAPPAPKAHRQRRKAAPEPQAAPAPVPVPPAADQGSTRPQRHRPARGGTSLISGKPRRGRGGTAKPSTGKR